MTRAAFTVLTLASFGLFLAWAGDNLAGPNVQPLDTQLRDIGHVDQLIESKN